MNVKGSRDKKIAVMLLGLLLLGLIISANLWKSSLRVKTITVEGNRIVETNEILQLVQIQRGSLMYAVDLTALQRNVESHHYIKSATVERDLPSTIKVTVGERKPIALVNGPEMVYLDDEGVVLPHSISKALFDLPLISGIPGSVPLKLGSAVEQEDVLEALEVLRTMKLVNREQYYQVSELQVRTGGDLILYTAEGGVPIIFGRGAVADKLLRLEAFWNNIVRDRGTQNLQYVDLRYEDQIVVRWKSAPTTMKNS